MRWFLLVAVLALVGCSAKLGPGKYGWTSWDLENRMNLDLKVPAFGSLCIGCLYEEPAADPNAPED